MKRFLLTSLMGVLCIYMYANSDFSGIVKGKVIDSKSKEELEFVNVSVREKKSNELMKGTITDDSGFFELDGLQEGEYTLTISYIGYKPYQKELVLNRQTNTVNLLTIHLSEDSQVIGEIEVVAQKSQMRFEIDKKVFNVEQNIASAGGSASDILGNIPSVEVDNEGEVSLRGSSSVTIWINGKPSGLSEDNRAQILEQLPAESIEKIEVITNPSARYSPEGTAGIINIVLKQDRKGGYYGSLQTGVDSRGGYNASGNINYSSGKLDAYASIGYRERKRAGGGYTNRINTEDDSFLKQWSDDDGGGGNIFTRLGFTYHLTQKDHLTFGAFGMFGSRNSTTTIDYESNIPGSFVESQRISESDNDMNGGNIEIGYKHEFSKNSYLDFTASYNKWDMDNTNLYTQKSVYDAINPVPSYSYQQQLSNIRNNNWEIQLDYINAFNDNAKLEAGYKGSLGRENSPVETYSKINPDAKWSEERELFNRFIYNKDIHAIYTTYSGRYNKLGYQLGLRGEYSNINTKSLAYGENKEGVEPYKTDYFSLFPSAYLTYALPKNNEVQVNYTRRISRPWGGQLNSFMNITDSTNISYGNPYLKPQYSNAFELNYIKSWEDHMLSFSGYYRNTDDVIQRIRFLDGNVMKTTSENIAQTQSAGVEIVGKNKLFSFVDLTTTVNLFYYKLDGFEFDPQIDGADLVVGKPEEDFSWNMRMIANFMLPQSISLQLTGNYNSKQVVAQGYRKANYSLDAGIRKTFFDRKLSVSINGRDLLDSRKWHTVTTGTGFEQNSKNWRGGRQVGLTLTYSFGNMRAKSGKPNRNSDSGNGGMESMDSEY